MIANDRVRSLQRFASFPLQLAASLTRGLHRFRETLSQFFGPANAKLVNPYEAALTHGPGLIRRILDRGLWDDSDYLLFYNVNFPPLPAHEVKGTKVANQGFRRYTSFSLEPHVSPTGRQFLWIKGGEQGRSEVGHLHSGNTLRGRAMRRAGTRSAEVRGDVRATPRSEAVKH